MKVALHKLHTVKTVTQIEKDCTLSLSMSSLKPNPPTSTLAHGQSQARRYYFRPVTVTNSVE